MFKRGQPQLTQLRDKPGEATEAKLPAAIEAALERCLKTGMARAYLEGISLARPAAGLADARVADAKARAELERAILRRIK